MKKNYVKVTVGLRRKSRDNLLLWTQLVDFAQESLLEHGFWVNDALLRLRRLDSSWRVALLLLGIGTACSSIRFSGSFLGSLLQFVLGDHLARLGIENELGNALGQSVSHFEGVIVS